MTTRDKWFEELCRHFVAKHFGVPVERVVSTHLDGATRPGAKQRSHQIDLYIEDAGSDALVRLDVIVDAKWRTTGKVDQNDVQNWASVAVSTGARVAMMLSNTDFTEGARAAAEAARIVTAIVAPTEAALAVPFGPRQQMLAEFGAIHASGASMFAVTSVTRSIDPPRALPDGWLPPNPGSSATPDRGVMPAAGQGTFAAHTRVMPAAPSSPAPGGSGSSPAGHPPSGGFGGFTRGGGGWNRG